MVKMGWWRVHSEIDKRWNQEGKCLGSCFSVPDMEDWINRCKKEYGEPPEDCTNEFWKD